MIVTMTLRMKKIPAILVVCMLLFSSLDVLAQQNNAGSAQPAQCCFKLCHVRLPKEGLVKFQRTHTFCTHNAVVFSMKNKMKYCVDPTQKWVQEAIDYAEKHTTTARKQ